MLERIDVYLTLIAAVVLVVLDLVNVIPEQQMSSVNVAVLALISLNLLLTRVKLDEIVAGGRREQTPVTLGRFAVSYDQDWTGGGDVLLYGTSLLDTIITYQQWIAARLARGSRVRVLLMKPHSQAVILAAERCYMRTNHHDDAALQSVLDLLTRFQTETGGALEIRFTRQEPTFTAVCFDLGSPRAVLYVMYYRYRMNSEDQMRLTLRHGNGPWFDLHSDQIENLWRDAEWDAGWEADPRSAMR